VGCLKRVLAGVGCLVVLLAAALAAWVFRDRITAAYRRVRGVREPPPVVYVKPAADGAARAAARLGELARRGGPAYVDLSAGDLAALIDRQLARAPRRAFDSIGVSLGDQRIRVRGSLDMTVLPRNLLGPLGHAFGAREPVMAGGAVSVPSAGRMAWTVDELSIRDFPFPKSVIPAIVSELRVPDARGASVPIPLPAPVGDVRIGPAGVRLYRARAR
jgi:hypothetical protein